LEELAMILERRRTDDAHMPAWCTVGARVWAAPPTVSRPIAGIVAAVERTTITVETGGGLLVAVDVEDCRPSWTG
jgi:hypothetical protein